MSKTKQIALGIGIAIILAVFTGFLAWQLGNDFEKNCMTSEMNTATCCKQIPGTIPKTSDYYFWTTTAAECTAVSGSVMSDKALCSDSYMYNEVCNDKFKQVFGTAAVIVGILALGVGIFMRKNNAIEGGLIGGAIINFIMALVSFWEWLDGWLRVVLAGVILAGLLVLAWYKTKD
jgi:hypothetical protein